MATPYQELIEIAERMKRGAIDSLSGYDPGDYPEDVTRIGYEISAWNTIIDKLEEEDEQ